MKGKELLQVKTDFVAAESNHRQRKPKANLSVAGKSQF